MAVGSELRVLVVEDNPADAFRVQEALEAGGRGRFRPTFVGALGEAEPRLASADLVLLDLTLPDSSGSDTVARVRSKAPVTPVVVLSGERDETMAFRCLQHGAQDVLLKGSLDGDALVRALSCALERQALARERDEALLKARAAVRIEEEIRDGVRRLANGVSRGLGEHLGVVLEGAFELSDGQDAAAYGPALKIQRAAWQARGLVRQLLASAGEAKAAPEPLDLNEIVASQWDAVEENGTETVSFARDLAAGLPRVLADRRLIEQAFCTLVEHARNSVAGGGVVTVRTSLDPAESKRGRKPPREGGLRGVLSVSDTGPALGPPACRRLFEPFYSTEELGIGTGIGLAPVLGIAVQAGGTADVRSVPGRGTTVRILLPVVDGDGGGEAFAQEAGDADEVPGPPLPRGKETLLLAEGDPLRRWRIYATLQGLGYRVLSAACVGDAVRLASHYRGPIPLLLAEQRAAGMSGAVLAGVLRCRRPGMRSLLLADGAGGNGVLGCPFRGRELAVAVRTLLDLPTRGSVSPVGPFLHSATEFRVPEVRLGSPFEAP